MSNESSSEMLSRLGTDPTLWAAEYAKQHGAKPIDGEPGGLLHGWFANAIQAGRFAGYVEAALNPQEAAITREALAPAEAQEVTQA